MDVGMVSDFMAGLIDLPCDVRIVLYLGTFHKKSGRDVVLLQELQDGNRKFARAVIEGERDHFFEGPLLRRHMHRRIKLPPQVGPGRRAPKKRESERTLHRPITRLMTLSAAPLKTGTHRLSL